MTNDLSVIHCEIDKKFLGVPYKFGGRAFDGADCVGLLILWFKEQGIHYQYRDKDGPIHADWFRNNPRRLVEAVTQYGNLIRFSDLQKNDVLMITNNGDESIPICLAVMADARHILTTNDKQDSFVEMLNLEWKARFWGGIRLTKVAEAAEKKTEKEA